MVRFILVFAFVLAFLADVFSQVNMHQYAPIRETQIKNMELAEVLGLCELKAEETNESYSCRIFGVFSGPSDPGFEGCNNSCYYYVANVTTDLPLEYSLFKIGPFYEPSSVFLQEKSSGVFRLAIGHKRFEKEIVSAFAIEFRSVRKDK